MKRFKFCILLLLFGLTINARAETGVVDDSGIIPYLDKVVAWHHEVKAIDVSQNNGQELLLDNSLRKNADQILTSAFDLARAEANAIQAKNPGAAPATSQTENGNTKIAQYIDEANKDADEINTQLDDINSKIAAAPSADRPPLTLKKKTLESGAKLVKARQDLLQNVVKMSNKPVDDEGGLIGQINNLARTLPEIQNNSDETKTGAVKTESVSVQTSANDSKGIVGLIEDMWGGISKRRDIHNLFNMTTALRENNQTILESLRGEFKSTVDEGNAIADGISNTADADIAAQKTKLDNLAVDFKNLSNIVIPLNQANSLLDNSKKTLTSWDNLLLDQLHKTLHRLAIRLAILGVAILIPLALSRVAHRTTMRYVKDPKRQRQLHIVRRTVFGIIIGIVILLNLITEYGSLITFAGFITAGIAVALQTVILSVVAHFFFLGRYGIKVGDQVSVGSTTGEVIKVGIIRFYVMELTGTDFNLNPTGRIVIYPNAVLFQPQAFTKLIPGTNYTWSEIKVKIDPSTDYDLANKVLNDTVTRVYSSYKEIMAKQQNALQEATHYGVKIPMPMSHLRVTDAGFIFLVRYPIAINKASEIKDRFTKELLLAIKAEPGIKLA